MAKNGPFSLRTESWKGRHGSNGEVLLLGLRHGTISGVIPESARKPAQLNAKSFETLGQLEICSPVGRAARVCPQAVLPGGPPLLSQLTADNADEIPVWWTTPKVFVRL